MTPWKVIQRLHLHISHQIRLYSSVTALWGLSCTCFTDIWTLEQFEETGSKYPKSYAGTHRKYSRVFSITLTLNEVLFKRQGFLRVKLYLVPGILNIRAIWGKMGSISSLLVKQFKRQDILLLHNYLKSNCENSEIRYKFCPHFFLIGWTVEPHH